MYYSLFLNESLHISLRWMALMWLKGFIRGYLLISNTGRIYIFPGKIQVKYKKNYVGPSAPYNFYRRLTKSTKEMNKYVLCHRLLA